MVSMMFGNMQNIQVEVLIVQLEFIFSVVMVNLVIELIVVQFEFFISVVVVILEVEVGIVVMEGVIVVEKMKMLFVESISQSK